MRFGVLGPLAVWAADGKPVRIPELKVRALLADLLVHEGRPVSADRLVDDLWGETPPGNPANTLQTKVSQLRRALEAAEPGARSLVAYEPSGYLLRIGPEALDASRFAALTAQARTAGDPEATAAALTEALALWRGPALADFADEPFAQPTITRLEEARLAALEAQAEARLALGEHHQLTGELAELVARHPLRERLRAVHMRALYRAGRQSDALAAYGELRERLREELGLDPGPELTALHQAILRQDPALEAPAPPVPAPPPAVPARAPSRRPRQGNLPTPRTDLIGRDGAVTQVRALLETGRLVTLTGAGGVGKTRLAVAAATHVADWFADGAWLVELAAVGSPSDAEAVGAQVLAALDVRQDGAAALQTLAAALQHRRLLLVLDNCERLTEPVAELVGRLLPAAPGLKVLATSQEPLGLAGEVLWAVPPLDCPAAGTDAAADPSALERWSAVGLFVARASAAAPGFTLHAGNAETVATICRRLEGIPLALELAARRVRSLGVHGLADRLDARLELLSGGYRDAPPRQQTLRATIDWSWELLSEPERAVLRRLAVHADGCTLEAAEDVCAGGGIPPGDVLDLLARLVDRSLVNLTDSAEGPRYRLLESVAAYCLERLDEAAETQAVRRRHRRHYIALAERAEPRLRGDDQRRWLERLDRETANLRSALDGAVGEGDADGALRLVNALAWYWVLRGRLTEARRALDAVLARDGPCSAAAGHAAARATATAWQAGIALLAGEHADRAARTQAALRLYDQVDDPRRQARAEWFLGFVRSDWDVSASEELVRRALAGCRAVGDRWGVAAALATRAKQAWVRSDFAALRRDGAESLALFRQLGDRWGQLQATEWLGALAQATGDYEQATRLHTDGLRMAEELGLWPQAADRLAWLGKTASLIGDHTQARELLERAMRLAAGQGYVPGEGFAEIGLGGALRRAGKLDLAETHLRNVLEWTTPATAGTEGAAEPLHPGPHAEILAELGFIAELRGDAATARALHLKGFGIARALGDDRAVALACEGLAGAHALAGRHDHAAVLLGAAAALRESAGVPLPAPERDDVNRITAAARKALGEQAFAARLAHGARLTPEEAAAEPP